MLTFIVTINLIYIMPNKIQYFHFYQLGQEPMSLTDELEFFYLPMAFNIVILLFNIIKCSKELEQYKTCKKEEVSYINDIWNFLDLVGIFLIYLYGTLDLIHTISYDLIDLAYLQAFASITQFVIGVRFLAYCRGIKSMSFMIRLLT
jgi:hypothetical protein